MHAASALQRVAPAEPVVVPRAVAETETGLSVTLRNIHKAFGAKPVLSGIDLHIPAGQFVAIVGKSGCGKSTLLRMVAGLETPSRGTLALGSGESARQAVRIMFQEPRLLPWARVQANVEVGLRPGHNGAQGRQRAESLLAEVGLADRKGEWPSVLSGGQRQRVALARALASEPSVLALDEPLGALDALTRIEMQSLLEAVWLSQGFTAILVTHDVTEALSLADRVVLLDEGRVALDLAVPIARPRRRGSPEIGALEETILDRLFRRKPQPA